MFPRTADRRGKALLAGVLIAVGVGAYGVWHWGLNATAEPTTASASTEKGPPPDASVRNRDSVDLSDSQLAAVKVEPIEERAFPVEKEAIGSIDFNEDMAVQVFTPYQGRIIALYASVGDDVKKGQTLFTIDSPDLLQAELTLIAAAGVLELTSRNLARLRELYKTLAVSQHDLEQAISDQQTAEGNLRAARDAVRIFGKIRRGNRSHRRRARRRSDSGRGKPDRRPNNRSATRRRVCSSNRVIRPRHMLSPISIRCGCWRMSSRPTVRHFASGSRCKWRSALFQGACSTARLPRSAPASTRIPAAC